MREARFETRKVPKPVRVTECPLERLLVTASRTASRASVAAFFVMPALCAAMLIRSPFVMAMALMDKSRLIIGGSGLRARKKITSNLFNGKEAVVVGGGGSFCTKLQVKNHRRR